MLARRLFAVLAALGLIAFLLWLFLVFLPVIFVETKYQFTSFFRSLGFTNMRSFFMPNPEDLTIVGNTSKNKQYGILIPKLSIDSPVVFNVDPNDEAQYKAALKQGIAHASSTSLPDESGLGYYFAHSSNPSARVQYNAIFYLLDKLVAGDEVYIWNEGKRYRYIVSDKMVKEPADTAFLYQAYGEETIVLQTCWPPGTTKQRLLVFARRADH